MVRPYAVKGRKRKKNKTERYDQEEDEEQNVETEEGVKKLKSGVTESDEEKAEEAAQELAGIPVSLNEQGDGDKMSGGVVFVLEKASLEVAKVGKVCFFLILFQAFDVCVTFLLFWRFVFGKPWRWMILDFIGIRQ